MFSLLDQTMEECQENNQETEGRHRADSSKIQLVSFLVQLEREKLKEEMATKECTRIRNVEQLTLCPICNAVFVEPVTLPCGHTFCNICILDEFSSRSCVICNLPSTGEIAAPTFLLCSISSKWFPEQTQFGEIKNKARKLITQGDFKGALDNLSLVDEGSELLDLNYYCLRANGNVGLGRLNLALKDLDIATELNPCAIHILGRKAQLLMKMGDFEKALAVYIRLVALQPKNPKIKQELLSILKRLLHVDLSSLKETLSQAFVNSANKKHGLSGEHFVNEGQRYEERNFAVFDNGLRKRKCTSELGTKNSEQKEYDKEQSTCRDEFDCKLCCSLLYKPVTSPCGHTFCDECLRRSLDFRVDCPCCRTPLTKYLAERRTSVTIVIENIIKQLYPREHQLRMESFENELKSMQRIGKSAEFEVPIFVCTLAFPSVPCPLHIFEPRYKLMIRRCIESGSRQFGMCAPSPDTNHPIATTGTMLMISDIAYLPDGRSLINTEGSRRFQVISSQMKDGYNIAKVKWLDDEKVESEEEKKEILKLHIDGYKLLNFWFKNLSSKQKECIVNAIGEIPKFEEFADLSSDQPSWLWWSLAALPLMDRPKLIILSMTSKLERLRSMWRFLMLMIKGQQKNVAKEK